MIYDPGNNPPQDEKKYYVKIPPSHEDRERAREKKTSYIIPPTLAVESVKDLT
jgi:hypothetical protein